MPVLKYRHTPPRPERHTLIITAESSEIKEWITPGPPKAYFSPTVKAQIASYAGAKARSFCDGSFYYFEISFASKDDVDSFDAWFKLRYG